MPKDELISGDAEQAARQALIQVVRPGANNRFQQRWVNLRRDDGSGIQGAPGVGREPRGPRQYSVTHCSRDRVAIRCQDLRQEKGIPAGQVVQRGGVPAGARSQARHGGIRQR